MKFKVGDKVKIINVGRYGYSNHAMDVLVGKYDTIRRINNDGDIYLVNNHIYIWSQCAFEKIGAWSDIII